MITKCFTCNGKTQRKEILWSLEASEVKAVAVAEEVSATFDDVYALMAWSEVYQRNFGALPKEKIQ